MPITIFNATDVLRGAEIMTTRLWQPGIYRAVTTQCDVSVSETEGGIDRVLLGFTVEDEGEHLAITRSFELHHDMGNGTVTALRFLVGWVNAIGPVPDRLELPGALKTLTWEGTPLVLELGTHAKHPDKLWVLRVWPLRELETRRAQHARRQEREESALIDRVNRAWDAELAAPNAMHGRVRR